MSRIYESFIRGAVSKEYLPELLSRVESFTSSHLRKHLFYYTETQYKSKNGRNIMYSKDTKKQYIDDISFEKITDPSLFDFLAETPPTSYLYEEGKAMRDGTNTVVRNRLITDVSGNMTTALTCLGLSSVKQWSHKGICIEMLCGAEVIIYCSNNEGFGGNSEFYVVEFLCNSSDTYVDVAKHRVSVAASIFAPHVHYAP